MRGLAGDFDTQTKPSFLLLGGQVGLIRCNLGPNLEASDLFLRCDALTLDVELVVLLGCLGHELLGLQLKLLLFNLELHLLHLDDGVLLHLLDLLLDRKSTRLNSSHT